MDWLFRLPLIVTGPAIIVILVGTSLAALNWFRKHRLPRLRFGDGDVEFSAAMLTSIMVFYGLATALTAVQVWEGYERAKDIVEQEASSLGTFYRNVSQYPEPVRSVLRGQTRAYTYQLIHDAWPEQRRGMIPIEGVRSMDEIQPNLMGFVPTNEAQKGMALETLASYGRLVDARRIRVNSLERKLPGVLWVVIVLGAFISLVSAFYFPVLDPRLHRVQVGLLATFIGLVIFIILALDRPFQGDLAVKSTPYQIVYEQLMAR